MPHGVCTQTSWTSKHTYTCLCVSRQQRRGRPCWMRWPCSWTRKSLTTRRRYQTSNCSTRKRRVAMDLLLLMAFIHHSFHVFFVWFLYIVSLLWIIADLFLFVWFLVFKMCKNKEKPQIFIRFSEFFLLLSLLCIPWLIFFFCLLLSFRFLQWGLDTRRSSEDFMKTRIALRKKSDSSLEMKR